MIVNVNLDKNNKIVNINKDNSIEIEIEKPELIHFGFSKIINGIFYENKEQYESFIEMQSIKRWLSEHDYIVNKHTLGEYTDNDIKWLDYLEKRKLTKKEEKTYCFENSLKQDFFGIWVKNHIFFVNYVKIYLGYENGLYLENCHIK